MRALIVAIILLATIGLQAVKDLNFYPVNELPIPWEYLPGLTLALLLWLMIELVINQQKLSTFKSEKQALETIKAQQAQLQAENSSHLRAIEASTQRAVHAESAQARTEKQVRELQSDITALQQALNDSTAQIQELMQRRAQPGRSTDLDSEILNFLGILQDKARFIDFAMDDITAYSDPQVAAAARFVHQGCKDVLKEFFQIEPVSDQAEGSVVTVEADYDPRRNRIIGDASHEPPFRGRVIHRGWKSDRVTLPRSVTGEKGTGSSKIIAPVQVEIAP